MAVTVGDPSKDSQISDALPGAASKRKYPPPPGHEAPWLFSLRPPHDQPSDSRERALAIRISPDGTADVVYNEEVPDKYLDHCLVTSQGNHIVLKTDYDQDRIYLVDPFSSWTQLRSFPRRRRGSKTWDNVSQLVTHGDLAVAIQGMFQNRLVYLRSGRGDDGWIALDKMTSLGSFSDILFREHDGFFYALNTPCNKVVRLSFVTSSEIQGDDADVNITDMSCGLGPGFNPDRDRGWCCCLQLGSLVDSPSGLFLVRWRMLLKLGEQKEKKREIDVYKLSEDDEMWVRVDFLDDHSFFLGINQSLAASPEEFPDLRTNLIYIPYDACHLLHHRLLRVPDYMREVENNLIYDVKNDSWGNWDPLYGIEDRFLKGMTWPSVWMKPPHVWEAASKRKLEEQLQAVIEASTSDSSGSLDVVMSEQRSEP